MFLSQKNPSHKCMDLQNNLLFFTFAGIDERNENILEG
jgi:hypothetical protein